MVKTPKRERTRPPFPGKLSGFETKEEQAHHKRWLRAWLKADMFFRNGFVTLSNTNQELRVPAYYSTLTGDIALKYTKAIAKMKNSKIV